MWGKRQAPLAVVMTFYTALVLAGGMAVYALVQYLLTPERSILGLVLEHGWHVVALAAVTYLALNMVLYRKVTRPIRELDVKLYAISKGDFSPVTVESDIKEVQEIAEVVTFLIGQIAGSLPGNAALKLSECSARIQSLAKESEGIDNRSREVLMDVARKMDGVLETLSMSSLEEARS